MRLSSGGSATTSGEKIKREKKIANELGSRSRLLIGIFYKRQINSTEILAASPHTVRFTLWSLSNFQHNLLVDVERRKMSWNLISLWNQRARGMARGSGSESIACLRPRISRVSSSCGDESRVDAATTADSFNSLSRHASFAFRFINCHFNSCKLIPFWMTSQNAQYTYLCIALKSHKYLCTLLKSNYYFKIVQKSGCLFYAHFHAFSFVTRH